MLAEQLDIPSLGLVSEGDSIDTIALLETALLFSTGINDLPLSRLFNSLMLWAQQPQYLVRGSFEKINGQILLSLQIIDRKRKQVAQAWDHQLADESHRRRADIVDAVLYPLLFYFTKKIEASRWEALHALHVGLEEFQSFNDHQDQIIYLMSAQENIERAISLDPAYRLAHYDLGLAYLAGGDYETAREHLLDASRLFDGDITGKKATYNYGVALFLLAQDWAYERAVKTFQTLIESGKLPSDLVYLTRSSLAATYAKMAARSRDKKEALTEKAFIEADFVLNLKTRASNEATANAWIAKGYAYLALGQSVNAKSAFSAALKFDPNHRTALIGLGAAEFALQNMDEALSALKQASALSPQGGYAHYRIGNLYREMKDLDSAVVSYKKAGNTALARLALGKIYLEKGLLQDALEEFRSSVKINSRLSDGWNNIAWTILELDDPALFEEAENAARRAVQLEKQENLFWHRRAVLSLCLARRGKLDMAFKEALAGVDLGPKEAQAYFVLGCVHLQMGRSADARENLSRVLELDKKGRWRVDAQQLIEKINAPS
jgi:tetratricopeptide (TPR) repeat protein